MPPQVTSNEDAPCQVLGELLVAFRGDDSQCAYLEAEHALAFLVHAQAQTAADGLAALALCWLAGGRVS